MRHIKDPVKMFDCAVCGASAEKQLVEPNCPGAKLEPQRAPITDVERELKDPDLDKLENWFSYHPPTAEQVIAYGQLRDGAYMMARCILLHCPSSADRTAALRKLRECVMTANASIACGGK